MKKNSTSYEDQKIVLIIRSSFSMDYDNDS